MVTLVLLFAFEAIPGVPGHPQAALAGDLIASDGGALVATITPGSTGPKGQPCADLEATFGVGNNLLKESKFGIYASIWPSYQALNAFYVTGLQEGRSQCGGDFQRTLTAIDQKYWSNSVSGYPPAYDQGPKAIHLASDLPRVDDSLWMGLEVMLAYMKTKNAAFLQRGEAVFRLAVANWDRRQGGVYWEDTGKGNYSRAVVSNAPAAILGVELYHRTGQARYLRWSERIFQWLEKDLFDPGTRLFDDHIGNDTRQGAINKAKFTYNQGLMVALMAELSRINPTRYPIGNAVELADRAMAYFQSHHSYGQPWLDAIWAQDVLWTAARSGSAAFTAKAQESVRAAAAAAPRKPSGLLDRGGEATLKELESLPTGKYHELFPTT